MDMKKCLANLWQIFQRQFYVKPFSFGKLRMKYVIGYSLSSEKQDLQNYLPVLISPFNSIPVEIIPAGILGLPRWC